MTGTPQRTDRWENRVTVAANDLEAWNRLYPVGTAVVLTKDNGDTVETTTRAPAKMLGGHTAVIWLDGFGGCWALDRVTPATTQEGGPR